ncbi:MAG: PAS domain S-box protein, partial [Smithellaceae bacterium]|nr:PAS domain S-box protein [Smithellaceae bacterium]
RLWQTSMHLIHLSSFWGVLYYSMLSILLLGAMFLTKAGFWRVAVIILPLLMYFPAVNANYIGGVNAPGNFMYAILIMFVVFIYGHRKMWIALVICLATYLSLAWMISTGYIKPFRTTEVVFVNRVVLVAGFLVSVSIMIWLLARSYESEIKERIKAEELLNKQNEELSTLNEALRENESHIKSISNNLPSGMIYQLIMKADGTRQFTYVSDSVKRLHGATPDEVMADADRIYGNVYEDDVAMLKKAEDEALKTLSTFSVEVRQREPSGGIRWSQLSSTPTLMEDGAIRWDGIELVVSERKHAEEALLESERKYRTIIEQMEEGYYELDLAGNYTFVNDAQCRILGYSRDELIGMNNRRYQDQTNAKVMYRLFNGIYRTGDAVASSDVEIIGKDGMKRFLEVSVSLKRNGKGETIGFRGIAHDVTDQKKAEDEKRKLEDRLQRAEKMEILGRMAGGVAHDLNNVLGALSGYSELMLMQIPEGQKTRDYAEKIITSTQKGSAIIQDLLTLTRRGVTVSDVINLNDIVSAFFKTPLYEKIKDDHPEVTFRAERDESLLNIKGSMVHLEKTLMNLVLNAAEAISGKGEVTVRTENRYLDKPVKGYDEIHHGDYAILSVTDTGAGIPEENREKIFEPFYTKKTMQRSGTGLGLSIVWGSVKDHNGYIDLQTEVGRGTTFTLYFPITREEVIVAERGEPIERFMGNGESILIVDDMADQRDVASGLLQKLGYKVHAVSSGEEAVEYLRKNEADLLLLDMIMLPGMDGMETYRKVLEINPKQKAVIVSGFSETDRVREAQKRGAGAYVKKPYVLEKIGVAIRDELKRQHAV